MLRDFKLRVKCKKRSFYPIKDISYKAVHLSAKRINNRVYLKKLIWVLFENEKCYQAIPWEYLDFETQKRKAAKFHLEHTTEIKHCETLITTKQNQKTILEQELQKATSLKWINANILREEIKSIDNSIEKHTAWRNK